MKLALYLGLAVAILVALCLWLNHQCEAQPDEQQASRVERSPSTGLPSAGKEVLPSGKTYPNAPVQEKEQPTTLNAGGLSMSLAFEDADIDQSLRQLIAIDLNRVFGHLGEYEMLSPAESYAPVTVNGQPYAVSSLINFVGKGRYIPDSLEPFTGRVIDKNGSKEFVVSKEMQALYRAAQTLAKQHPDVFESLPDFVAKLNRLTEEPPKKLEDIIYFGNLSAEETKAVEGFGSAQLVRTFGDKEYRSPSMLEILASTSLSEADANTWTARLFVTVEGGISDAATTAVYTNGCWKLLFSSTTL
jgi:hypothetical protein